MKRIEYRVRPVTRYIVTRWEGDDNPNTPATSVTERGEYDNADTAYEVGYALCRAEHETLGYPPGDERIQYPEHPKQKGAALDNAPAKITPEMAEAGSLEVMKYDTERCSKKELAASVYYAMELERKRAREFAAAVRDFTASALAGEA